MSNQRSAGVSVATVRHVCFVFVLVCWLILFSLASGAIRVGDNDEEDTLSAHPPDPWSEYGRLWTTILIAIRLLSFLALPQTCFNLVGLTCFNAWDADSNLKLKNSPLLAPFLCVRVVTRGQYADLVRRTVKENIQTLTKAGLENYTVQVVTDKPLDLEYGNRVQQVVVPSSYKTKTGALNKSRALQYCLEDDVNTLGDDDWIIHLDEETLLTERSVRGILNFICDGKHDFGQGLITYAANPPYLESWSKSFQYRICTVADSFRVADDMGKLRCQLKVLHKPLFGWKGSYVVTRAGSEKQVSFDNGPEGSKAEDCFFALKAVDQGFSFDFIEGEMHERSPFTFSDFFKQRKRWMQGIFMVVTSPRIKMATKTLLAISLASWLTIPITILNMGLCKLYPMSLGTTIDLGLAFLGGMGLFMYGFGYIKQHPIHRYSWARLVFAVPEIVLSSVLSICVENLAVFTIWFGDWYDFYIVEKETDEERGNTKRNLPERNGVILRDV